MPLTLSRRVGQSVRVGLATITVVKVTKGRVELRFDAPPSVNIARTEADDHRDAKRPPKPKETMNLPNYDSWKLDTPPRFEDLDEPDLDEPEPDEIEDLYTDEPLEGE